MSAFFGGHCAAYPASSGRLADAQAYCGHYGTEFGVAPMVGYGGYSTSVSMGMLVPLDNGDQQRIAAAWEFIKFLYADEQVVEFAKETGYLPMTCSASKHPDMLAYWEENPYAKVGFDQLEHATGHGWSAYWSQWLQEIDIRIAMVIGERTMLPDEAVDDLRREAAQIFP